MLYLLRAVFVGDWDTRGCCDVLLKDFVGRCIVSSSTLCSVNTHDLPDFGTLASHQLHDLVLGYVYSSGFVLENFCFTFSVYPLCSETLFHLNRLCLN
jgi:hypothetical protein